RYRNKRRLLRHKLQLTVLQALVCGVPAGMKAHSPAAPTLRHDAVRAHGPATPTLQPDAVQATSAADVFCDTLQQFLPGSALNVAVYWRHWVSCDCATPKYRLRNLFPIPKLAAWPDQVERGDIRVETCMAVSNFCLAAFNCLEQGLKAATASQSFPARATAAQSSVQLHVADRVVRYLARLNKFFGHTLLWRNTLNSDAGAGSKQYRDLRTEDVDLPQVAATCEPLGLIEAELAAQIRDASNVFPGTANVQPPPRATAGIFAAEKTNGRQRKIWDGSSVSALAKDPPKPRRLANPSCFLELEVKPGEDLLFSKRDACTFFDVLKVPAELQPWLAQPPVRVHELLDAGMTWEDVLTFCDDGGESGSISSSSWLYPTRVVWPMGFSWSSAVAQSTTVATCLGAGIQESCILSPDHDPPADQQELVMVATDDTVLFHRSVQRGERTLTRLDDAFARNGIPRNRRKDVTLADSITALDCELRNNPPVAEPAEGRLGDAVCRTLDLLHGGVASPRSVHSLLGIWEWFALLQRGFFSIYSDVYSFVQLTPELDTRHVPSGVLNEFLTTLLLSPLLAAGLDRLPLATLIATDACPEYGFGVCRSVCASSEAADVCRMAERRGDFVRLTPCPEDPVELRRDGKPRLLKLTQRDFATVVSSRAKWKSHAGVLEVHGYLLGLKWVTRNPKRHHHKVAFLVDAKAVVGAASKGRSSAHAFLKVLRSAAAYTLGADILPRIVYIPSESNPADGPSRGKRRRRAANRSARKPRTKPKVF
ncbi:unnamed protein product, partial [Symbiodinium natans]